MELDRVICADALEFLRGLPDGCAQAVITDPPYNVGFAYADDRTRDQRADYASWCAAWFAECVRVSAVVAISCGYHNMHLWFDVRDPDYVLCWHKPAAMGRSAVGFNNWEPIMLYGRAGGALGCDVIRAPIIPDPSLAGHPCPKPIQWAIQLVRMLCPAGGTVIDPFMGSGQTALAAQTTGRHYIGCDISPEYVALAQDRLRGVRSRAGGQSQLALTEEG